jgi:uncharacterized protein (DUF302 family)
MHLFEVKNVSEYQDHFCCLKFKQKKMDYYFSKTLKNISIDEAIGNVTQSHKEEGFGILTEINVQTTLKKNLDEDFRPYKILRACNPAFAHKALQAEDNIGTMLPCNAIVQQKIEVEVAAVNPVASMQAVQNIILTTQS